MYKQEVGYRLIQVTLYSEKKKIFWAGDKEK